MENIKPYKKYKTTSISRIRNIPEHWDLVKLKFLSRITTGNKNTEDKEINGNYNFYVRSQKVARINSYSFEGEGILTAGDGVGVGKVFHYVNEKFDYHQRVYLFYNFSNIIHGKFLFYYLREFLKIDLMLYNAKSTVDSVRLPTLKDFSVSLPSKSEQTAIAAFLDYKAAKIDRFIHKKKQLIKLLNEQKAAIINDAVTGKINCLNQNLPGERINQNFKKSNLSSKSQNPDSDRKMKPSGIEWLGDIPEPWEVMKLKYVISLNDETLNEKINPDYELRYIDIGNVNENGEIREIVNYKYKNAPSRARRIVKKGDVIISTVRTYLKAITQILDDCENLIVSTGFAVLRPNDLIESNFLNYSVRANYFINRVCAESFGVSYPAINASELIELSISFPKKEEQHQIVSHIETETTKLNQTITTIEKEITLVQEYKTALIAEAVTGKIDVREYEIPILEETESDEEIEDSDSYLESMAAEDGEQYQTGENLN